MKRRVLGLIGAVVLALVGTIAIVAYVQGADDRALASEATVKVLVVQDNVPAGTPASELGDRVKLEKVTEKVRAEGAVSNTKALGEEVASATLVPGEQVVKARFVAPSVYHARGASVEVPPNLEQVTLSLAPERALGGVLTPGQTVAVTASFDSIDGQPKSTHTILQKVLVTNVQLADRAKADSQNSSTTDQPKTVEPGNAPTGVLLVTLAVDAPSLERVAFAAEHGTVWLSLDPKTAGEDGTRVQTRGTIYQ